MASIISEGAPKPMGAYPHAMRAGNLLFLSGIGPRTPETDSIPGLELDKHGQFKSFDFSAQCHSVFKNVQTVLSQSGANWNQLVDVTVFLTDMKRDFHTYNKIYAQYFKDHQPCRTTVSVTSLPSAIAIEIKCIAYLP